MWRVVTWNLDWWNKDTPASQAAAFSTGFEPDVVALQEVTSADATALREVWSGTALFSQEVHPPATWQWMGCGLLFGPRFEPVECGVVAELPKPQRSLWARVRTDDGRIVTAVSWHSPNAAGDGREVKMAAYAAMTKWLQRVDTPVIVGADLNTWQDPVDLEDADPAHPFFAELAFVGPQPLHRLVDAYRQVLDRTGELRRRRQAAAPGPLAGSYVLSDGTPHRFDRIFISDDLTAADGGYDYDGARAAGSDHALHWVDLDGH